MKRTLLATLLPILLVFGALMSQAQQPSPRLIPFQGRLTDQQGRPYTNGQFTLTFSLYSQAVGGTPLWTERHQKVGVINGMVNVFLGSINNLDNQDFSQTRHLGITIDADDNPTTSDPEMVPRQMIIPAFWAKNSDKLAGQDWTPIFGVNSPLGPIPAEKVESQGMVPAGAIVAFGGQNIPNGWLLCDGRALNSGTYPRLFAAIGTSWGAGSGGALNFNLPDFRGVFLRGTDNSPTTGVSGRDPDANNRTNIVDGGSLGNAVGSLQLQATRKNGLALNGSTNFASASHTHGSGSLFAEFFIGGAPSQIWARRVGGVNWMSDNSYSATATGGGVTSRTDGIPVSGVSATPSASGTVSLGAGDSETRPINAAVYYMIKY